MKMFTAANLMIALIVGFSAIDSSANEPSCDARLEREQKRMGTGYDDYTTYKFGERRSILFNRNIEVKPGEAEVTIYNAAGSRLTHFYSLTCTLEMKETTKKPRVILGYLENYDRAPRIELMEIRISSRLNESLFEFRKNSSICFMKCNSPYTNMWGLLFDLDAGPEPVQ